MPAKMKGGGSRAGPILYPTVPFLSLTVTLFIAYPYPTSTLLHPYPPIPTAKPTSNSKKHSHIVGNLNGPKAHFALNRLFIDVAKYLAKVISMVIFCRLDSNSSHLLKKAKIPPQLAVLWYGFLQNTAMIAVRCNCRRHLRFFMLKAYTILLYYSPIAENRNIRVGGWFDAVQA